MDCLIPINPSNVTVRNVLLEIPMKSSDINAWNLEVHPEQMCQVAAASQRARAEVQIKTLAPEEKKLVEVAKK